MRVDRPRVTGRDARIRPRPGAHGRLGAGRADARADALPDPALADRRRCSKLPKNGSDDAPDRRPGAPTRSSSAKQRVVDTPARDAQFVVTHERDPGPAVDGRARARRAEDGRQRCSPPRSRRAEPHGADRGRHAGAEADDRGRAGDGDHRARLELHDVLRRRPEPASTTSQLVAHLVDDTLIAPGKDVLVQRDDRRAERRQGLPRGAGDHQRRAPERARRRRLPGLDDRVQRRVRGGLPITARTNHALYISHYPQGRDATVNYPDIDLKFVNDTGHWLLLRTFVGSSSLTVNLYGTPQHRRVESETAPLVTTGRRADRDASRTRRS